MSKQIEIDACSQCKHLAHNGIDHICAKIFLNNDLITITEIPDWCPLPAAQDQWRDIASAPKDGTRVIFSSIRAGFVCWVSSGWWSDKWNKFYDGIEPSGFNNLTHWMPLPSLPEEK